MNSYSPRQVQCMQAMGLVPWVRRDDDEPAASPEPVASSELAASLEPAAAPELVASPEAHSGVKIEGNTNAQVLLIFANTGAQPTWPLSKADDALLDGMLRAIGLSKADICTCCVTVEADLARIEPTTPRQQFIYFGESETADTNLEPQSMALKEDEFGGWRLPTLAMLRNEPQRKRHSWITLKQLRAKLDQL